MNDETPFFFRKYDWTLLDIIGHYWTSSQLRSKSEADRRGKLLAELAQLAATLEAAGALFGSTARETPETPEPMSSEPLDPEAPHNDAEAA